MNGTALRASSYAIGTILEFVMNRKYDESTRFLVCHLPGKQKFACSPSLARQLIHPYVALRVVIGNSTHSIWVLFHSVHCHSAKR